MLLIVSQRGKLQICTLMLGNGQGWAWSDCIVYREIFPFECDYYFATARTSLSDLKNQR
jgi:hypothetical protein